MDGKICWVAKMGGGYTKEDGIEKIVQFVFERQVKPTRHTALKQEYKVDDSWSLGVRIGPCIHLSTFTWEEVC